MPRSSIGLDIGTSAVRAAEVAGKAPATLTRFGQVALPEGAVSAGEILDVEAVGNAIRDLWRRGGFRLKRVATAVANAKVVVRQVELPFMEEAELRDALQFQVQEYIPFPLEEAILDFQIIGEFPAEDGARMLRVVVVAAVRDMIDQFVGAIQKAGLTPTAIEYSAFAAARAIVEPVGEPVGEAGPEVLLDVGGGVTSILVHDQGTPRFVRVLPIGGRDVTQALIEQLGVTPEEAEGQKVTVGLPAAGAGAAEGPARIIEQRAAGFIEEVRSSIEYYHSQPGGAPVTRVVLIGGGSRLPHLGERLSAVLRLPVEEGRPLANVKLGKLGLSPEQLDEVSGVGAVAIGLALGGS